MFKLQYHPRAIKFLDKITDKERRKILQKLEILKEDPRSDQLNAKPLKDTLGSYRLRVGNIRIIYEISKDEQIIYIEDIDFRGSIY